MTDDSWEPYEDEDPYEYGCDSDNSEPDDHVNDYDD